MLQFGWSRRILLFPSHPVPVPILWWLYRIHRLQLVSPTLLCSVDFSCYFFLFFSFTFILWSDGTAKSTIRLVLCFCWQSLGLVVLPRLGDLFISENSREFCAFYFPGQILDCAYTICSYIKSILLAQFPVDHLRHPVVSCLIIFLC